MRAFRKDVVYWGKVIVLGVILGVGIQFARAWIEPTLPPPGGNVAGPLTTGAVDQVKSAGLGLVGNLVVGAIGTLRNICLNGDCRTGWPTPPKIITSAGLSLADFQGKRTIIQFSNAPGFDEYYYVIKGNQIERWKNGKYELNWCSAPLSSSFTCDFAGSSTEVRGTWHATLTAVGLYSFGNNGGYSYVLIPWAE